MNAFLTGSLLYGFPTSDSDIDLVIFCSEKEKELLLNNSDNNCIPIKYSKLNLIICTEEKQYIETPNPSSTNQTFATKDLADRLGMNSSTVSHWRPTGGRPKTPEQLLEITRKKDPDGIGWIYLPEVKRFQPERDIHSELPEALQSDSLITTEPEF